MRRRRIVGKEVVGIGSVVRALCLIFSLMGLGVECSLRRGPRNDIQIGSRKPRKEFQSEYELDDYADTLETDQIEREEYSFESSAPIQITRRVRDHHSPTRSRNPQRALRRALIRHERWLEEHRPWQATGKYPRKRVAYREPTPPRRRRGQPAWIHPTVYTYEIYITPSDEWSSEDSSGSDLSVEVRRGDTKTFSEDDDQPRRRSGSADLIFEISLDETSNCI